MRLVIANRPDISVQSAYALVFEFIRFFRLKQKLNDYHGGIPQLAPSRQVDGVWRLFLQDTVAYAQACGPTYRFIHRVPIKDIADGQRRLKYTRAAYHAEYNEDAPAEYWVEPEEVQVVDEDPVVLAPATPPAPTKRSRSRGARMSTGSVSRKRALVYEKFDVVAKTLTGKNVLVRDVHRDSSVTEFHERVAFYAGMPADSFHIKVDGIVLDMNKMLDEYKEFGTDANNIVVHLIQNLRGC